MSGQRDRYREIAEVLSRHGLGFMLGNLGMERLVPFHRGMLGHERRPEPYTRPEHVRLALEQLGAMWVKLGQILSTRADLLAPEYQMELARLQDAAPPADPQAIRDALAHELCRTPEEAFAAFDPQPLATGSIGQTHAARLHDGTEVVVMGRRPGVVEQVARDLEILQSLAARAARRWEPAADYDLVGVADEFARTLRAELDYLREGRNAERFAADFVGNPDVHIPDVHWETTTSRVLTLERISGIKVDDVGALDATGVDRAALAERATHVTARMVFEHGFFHADPHPGNFFIEPDGRIGIIDFGMVGEIGERLQDRLGTLLVALARADPDRLSAAIRELSTARGAVDRRRLRDDLARLVERYEGRAVGELQLGALAEEALAIVRRHRLQLPPELALLVKMVVMNEGMAARLDPDFRLGDVLAPYARRLAAQRLTPAALARRLGDAGVSAAQLAVDLPEQLPRLLAALEDGVPLHLRADELEPLVARAERLGNRLVAGMIAAALIDGLAELAAVEPPRWRSREIPLRSAGLAGAAALGVYLAWTGRRRSGP